MQVFEFAILNGIQESCRCAFLDAVLPFLSSLSNHGEIWIALALVLLFGWIYNMVSNSQYTETSYSDFRTAME